MYTKIQTQKSDYFITKGDVLISSGYDNSNKPELSKCDFDNHRNNWHTKIDSSCGIISYFNEFILVQNYLGIVCIVDYTNGRIIEDFSEVDFKISLPLYSKQLCNSLLNCYKGRLFERQYGFYDFLKKKETIFINLNSEGFWINNLFIVNNPKNFISVNCFLENWEWIFSLTNLEKLNPLLEWSNSEIVNIIGVEDGILWMDIVVKTYGGVLVGLDAQKGKIEHLLTDCLPINNQLSYQGEHLPYYCHSRYDKESNKIIGAVANIYWEVDLSEEKPIIKRWNFEKELEKYHAEFRPSTLDCAITPTHIITPVGGAIPRVVAFNRESHQIDWCYEFLEESTTIPDFMPLKAEATNTHLFVLISTGDLYIFEKTEDN